MDMRPRKKVSSACSYCKRRKRKCSTTLPCDNCIANNRPCVYGDAFDGRRKESMHRARIDSAFYKKLLQSLVERLRQGTDQDLMVLIDEKASLEAIATYLIVSSPHLNSDVDTSPQQAQTEAEDDRGHCDLKRLLRSFRALSGHRKALPLPGYVEVFGNLPFSSAISAAGYDAQFQQHQVSNFRLPPFMVQPLNFPPDQPSLTTLFVFFRDWCREAISKGTPAEVVLGPKEINLDMAIKGDREDGRITPLVWICELLPKFESIDIYMRLVNLHFIEPYLRWVICPTAENYALLPECMRPTLYQRLIPHHAAIDLCLLPALRDSLVQRDSPNKVDDREDIVVFQLAGARTNWDGDWNEAVVFDPYLGHRTLSQRFIETTSRIDEWVAGQLLLTKFPELEGRMRFAAEKTIPIDDRQIYEVGND